MKRKYRKTVPGKGKQYGRKARPTFAYFSLAVGSILLFLRLRDNPLEEVYETGAYSIGVVAIMAVIVSGVYFYYLRIRKGWVSHDNPFYNQINHYLDVFVLMFSLTLTVWSVSYAIRTMYFIPAALIAYAAYIFVKRVLYTPKEIRAIVFGNTSPTLLLILVFPFQTFALLMFGDVITGRDAIRIGLFMESLLAYEAVTLFFVPIWEKAFSVVYGKNRQRNCLSDFNINLVATIIAIVSAAICFLTGETIIMVFGTLCLFWGIFYVHTTFFVSLPLLRKEMSREKH